MKPDQPCQKQVSPPFSGEGLAQSCFLFSSFPLSHFVSHCLCRTQFEIYTCVHTSDPGFISHWTYSVHTQWFYHRCVCFFGSFPLSLSCPAFISPLCLSTHAFLYLISALQSPYLALGSHTSFSVVVWNWVFSGSQGSVWHSDPKGRAQCQLAFDLFSLLCYYFCFWSANGVDVFPIIFHWNTLHNPR